MPILFVILYLNVLADENLLPVAFRYCIIYLYFGSFYCCGRLCTVISLQLYNKSNSDCNHIKLLDLARNHRASDCSSCNVHL